MRQSWVLIAVAVCFQGAAASPHGGSTLPVQARKSLQQAKQTYTKLDYIPETLSGEAECRLSQATFQGKVLQSGVQHKARWTDECRQQCRCDPTACRSADLAAATRQHTPGGQLRLSSSPRVSSGLCRSAVDADLLQVFRCLRGPQSAVTQQADRLLRVTSLWLVAGSTRTAPPGHIARTGGAAWTSRAPGCQRMGASSSGSLASRGASLRRAPWLPGLPPTRLATSSVRPWLQSAAQLEAGCCGMLCLCSQGQALPCWQHFLLKPLRAG